MVKKMNVFMLRNYLRLRNKIEGFMEAEDGMEVLQSVILIAIAVVVAGVVMSILGKDDKSGLVKDIFDAIKDQLSGIGIDVK